MIYGIGTDIVNIARLDEMYARHGARALEKLLAEQSLTAHLSLSDEGDSVVAFVILEKP